MRKQLRWIMAMIAFAMAYSAHAQEISLWAGGGPSGFVYDIHGASNKQPMGYQAGIGYTVFLGSQFGIQVGAEFASFAGKGTLADGDADTYYSFQAFDNHVSPTAFECRVWTSGYEETQQAYFVNVPLILQFQTPYDGLAFAAQAGLKIGVPVSNKYKVNAASLDIKGYYENGMEVVIGNAEHHGFGTVDNFHYESEYDFNMSYTLTAEAGAKFTFLYKWHCYAGAYVDYSLNNVHNEALGATFITYNPSELPTGGNGMFSLTDDVRLFSFGIKLRVGFGERGDGRVEVVQKRKRR